MKNRKAILTYVDNNHAYFLTEFHWLYKSWRVSELETEWDIVVYCPSNFIGKHSLKEVLESQGISHENLIFREQAPFRETDPFWSNYGFVNSFAMFRTPEEQEWISQNYDAILKTDADVFVTKNLKGLETNKTVYVGVGGYQRPNNCKEIQDRLAKIAKEEFGLGHWGIPNIGASFFAQTRDIIYMCNRQIDLTKWFLEVEFKEDKGAWPGWFWGVSSMYAISIIVNGSFNLEHIKPYTLDEKCWGKTEMTNQTYHIHAWQISQDEDVFSKIDFHKGDKREIIRCKQLTEIPKLRGQYCKWIAGNTLEELLEFKLKHS